MVFITFIDRDIIEYRDNFTDDHRDKNFLISPNTIMVLLWVYVLTGQAEKSVWPRWN
jgi:hypothetical protein